MASTSTVKSGAANARGISGTPGVSSKASSNATSKILYVVRHGQALHNPRAEAAKEKGCSMEEFFRLMREDDALDSDLTDLGREQAKQCHRDHFVVEGGNSHNPLGIDLVVASCLSRTIDTADLVFPPNPSTPTKIGGDGGDSPLSPPRISIDKFREVNGNLLNGKRRTKSELIARNPIWNFDSLVTEEDESWTTEMEEFKDVAERGYRGLVELLTGETYPETESGSARSELLFNNSDTNTILLVCHGGILRYMMNMHPLVHLSDERTANHEEAHTRKSIESRFDNCELRKYRLSWKDDVSGTNDERSSDGSLRAIVLSQLDH